MAKVPSLRGLFLTFSSILCEISGIFLQLIGGARRALLLARAFNGRTQRINAKTLDSL
jgi:hypothetical protein